MANASEPLERSRFERTEAELRDQIERARTQIEDLDARARRAVQARPLIAIGSALLLGYALGRLVRR